MVISGLRNAQRSMLFDVMKSLLLVIMMLLSCTSCSSKRTIINGLDERDANEILVFLASKGIDAQKMQAKAAGPGGGNAAPTYDVSVDSDKAIEAMSILSANGLPRRRPQNLLDIFGAGGLVPSEQQEKVKYEAGLAEQIAGTIRKIDGVLDADVQLSFPEEDPLNPQAKKGSVTASVFVKHQGVLDDPNNQLTTKIRRLVASSVPGLNFDNVTVIADKARFAGGASQVGNKESSGNIPQLVKVWSVDVASASVARFQTIFMTLTALVFVTMILSLWLLWKVVPVARAAGGLRELFSLRPLMVAKGVEEHAPEEETPSAPEEEGREAGKKAQENIES